MSCLGPPHSRRRSEGVSKLHFIFHNIWVHLQGILRFWDVFLVSSTVFFEIRMERAPQTNHDQRSRMWYFDWDVVAHWTVGCSSAGSSLFVTCPAATTTTTTQPQHNHNHKQQPQLTSACFDLWRLPSLSTRSVEAVTTSFTDLANVTLEKQSGDVLSKMGREWCMVDDKLLPEVLSIQTRFGGWPLSSNKTQVKLIFQVSGMSTCQGVIWWVLPLRMHPHRWGAQTTRDWQL